MQNAKGDFLSLNTVPFILIIINRPSALGTYKHLVVVNS